MESNAIYVVVKVPVGAEVTDSLGELVTVSQWEDATGLVAEGYSKDNPLAAAAV